MLVYADNAATTRLSARAFDAMRPFLYGEVYGNPSSSHYMGQVARDAIETSRSVIARCIGAQPSEIYFTSGGTESDNWAIHIADEYGYYKNRRLGGVVSVLEHHAILNAAPMSGRVGANEDGIVEPRDMEMSLRERTSFASVMLANNEIGTIQPIKALSDVCHRNGTLFHTDAVQAVGHLPIDVKELGVDMLSASAHKFHGPKGVGFLYVREGIEVEPLLYGGHQERDGRAGTENVPGIVGMAAALREASEDMLENISHTTYMRERLIEGLWKIPGAVLNGHRLSRLPGIVNFCFDGVDGETLVVLLSERGIMCSSGSACMSGDREPSHVLTAIGRTPEQAQNALRLSIDHTNTDEDIDYILKTVPKCVEYLRRVGV